MSPKQEAAAQLLEKALKACAESKLGVYVYDGTVMVCPQPAGGKHPEWVNSPSEVCEELGKSFSISGLISDGGLAVKLPKENG